MVSLSSAQSNGVVSTSFKLKYEDLQPDGITFILNGLDHLYVRPAGQFQACVTQFPYNVGPAYDLPATALTKVRYSYFNTSEVVGSSISKYVDLVHG